MVISSIRGSEKHNMLSLMIQYSVNRIRKSHLLKQYVNFAIIFSLTKVMFSGALFVCLCFFLFVCWSVSNITQKIMNGLRWSLFGFGYLRQMITDMKNNNNRGKGYYKRLNQRQKYEKGPVYHQWNIDSIYIGIDSSNTIIHHVTWIVLLNMLWITKK